MKTKTVKQYKEEKVNRDLAAEVEQDKKDRVKRVSEGLAALLAKENCELVPVVTFTGTQMSANVGISAK